MTESINAIVTAINAVTNEMTNVSADSIPAMTKAIKSMATALETVAKVNKSVQVVEVTPAPEEGETTNVGIKVHEQPEVVQEPVVEEPVEDTEGNINLDELEGSFPPSVPRKKWETLHNLCGGYASKNVVVYDGDKRFCAYDLGELVNGDWQVDSEGRKVKVLSPERMLNKDEYPDNPVFRIVLEGDAINDVTINGKSMQFFSGSYKDKNASGLFLTSEDVPRFKGLHKWSSAKYAWGDKDLLKAIFG